MGIIVREVSKKFGDFQALKRVSLEVKPGSLVALLGPSGSGKSTLLRAIAGLEPPEQGQIIINGQDTTYLDIRKRNIGFVFQHYALFKEMTVKENIAFGLKVRKVSSSQCLKRLEELLDLIQLRGLGDRYPSQLSGGQRQRVALARALAVEPNVLLLDEPFGALDAKIRKDLRDWLRHLHQEVKVTTVFVTHDQEEAMEVADEIVVMNKGQIEQIGNAEEIYEQPATPFVMKFVGQVNIVPSNASLLKNNFNHLSEKEVFIRPHDIQLFKESYQTTAKAKIERLIHLGNQVRAKLVTNDGLSLLVLLSRAQFDQLDLKQGQDIFIQPKETKVFAQS